MWTLTLQTVGKKKSQQTSQETAIQPGPARADSRRVKALLCDLSENKVLHIFKQPWNPRTKEEEEQGLQRKYAF